MGLYVEESLSRRTVPRDHVGRTVMVTRSRSRPPVERSVVGEGVKRRNSKSSSNSGGSGGSGDSGDTSNGGSCNSRSSETKPLWVHLATSKTQACCCAYRRPSSSLPFFPPWARRQTIRLLSHAATSRVGSEPIFWISGSLTPLFGLIPVL